MKYRLILASSSPRRKELLKQMEVEFDILHPDIDEKKHETESPEEYVTRISKEKALKASSNIDNKNIVISADTIVVIENMVLRKPKDQDDARRMLKLLSGKTHKVITSFTIAKPKNKILHSENVETEVKIKNLADHEIESYIKTTEPMDKAGAYAIQGIGSFMVKKIKGSYENVVGLATKHLEKALRNLGILR